MINSKAMMSCHEVDVMAVPKLPNIFTSGTQLENWKGWICWDKCGGKMGKGQIHSQHFNSMDKIQQNLIKTNKFQKNITIFAGIFEIGKNKAKLGCKGGWGGAPKCEKPCS